MRDFIINTVSQILLWG